MSGNNVVGNPENNPAQFGPTVPAVEIIIRIILAAIIDRTPSMDSVNGTFFFILFSGISFRRYPNIAMLAIKIITEPSMSKAK